MSVGDVVLLDITFSVCPLVYLTLAESETAATVMPMSGGPVVDIPLTLLHTVTPLSSPVTGSLADLLLQNGSALNSILPWRAGVLVEQSVSDGASQWWCVTIDGVMRAFAYLVAIGQPPWDVQSNLPGTQALTALSPPAMLYTDALSALTATYSLVSYAGGGSEHATVIDSAGNEHKLANVSQLNPFTVLDVTTIPTPWLKPAADGISTIDGPGQLVSIIASTNSTQLTLADATPGVEWTVVGLVHDAISTPTDFVVIQNALGVQRACLDGSLQPLRGAGRLPASQGSPAFARGRSGGTP